LFFAGAFTYQLFDCLQIAIITRQAQFCETVLSFGFDKFVVAIDAFNVVCLRLCRRLFLPRLPASGEQGDSC
jgi:hypothetical protein